MDVGDRVLIVRGDLAGEQLAGRLRSRGAEVDDVIAYRTREAPETSRRLLRKAVADGPIAATVFTSGSTVRGLVSLGTAVSIDVRSLPFDVSPSPAATALAAATAGALVRQRQETP